MNTTTGNLEMAAVFLQRAIETARFALQPAEILERIDLLKRGAVNVKSQIQQGQAK